VWKKILALLDQRKERVKSELEKIEEAKLDISRMKADYESKLESIKRTS